MSLKPKLDERFLRLKRLADRLEPFSEGMTLVQSTNTVVAGEALDAGRANPFRHKRQFVTLRVHRGDGIHSRHDSFPRCRFTKTSN